MPSAVSKIAERLVEAAVALNSKVGSYIEGLFIEIIKEKKDIKSILLFGYFKDVLFFIFVQLPPNILNDWEFHIIQRSLRMVHALVIE